MDCGTFFCLVFVFEIGMAAIVSEQWPRNHKSFHAHSPELQFAFWFQLASRIMSKVIAISKWGPYTRERNPRKHKCATFFWCRLFSEGHFGHTMAHMAKKPHVF
jgi:hypothetical protein